MVELSRRSFIRVAVAGTGTFLLLAACGGESDDGADETEGVTGTQMKRYGPDGLSLAGEPTRLMAALTDADGVFLDDVPDSLSITISSIEGDALQGPITVPKREKGIPRPFFPFIVTLDRPGTYSFDTTLGGELLRVPFTVMDEANLAPVPRPGQPLPPVNTPTTANPGTTKAICTQDPPCPFHEVTLTEALAEGKPVAYLIGTPAHCSTGVCGPILDLMIEASEGMQDTIRFVHAEPYDDFANQETSAAVNAYGLWYEPVLFLAKADGTIDQRFDYLFDADELAEGLQRIL
jgi:hypothetical protein